ncbi:MAG: glycosyltransferase [Acidobacteria bacterium]|nr:glycosyltransferase [Acidobacteriota bacterium]
MGPYTLAFVHDWLVDFGGAERCLEAMCQEYPKSPIHTLFFDSRQFSGSAIINREISTTFLSRSFFKKRYRTFLALYPFAVEQLDVGSPDVVLSFSHSVAHGVLTRSDTLHVCYCFTPVRYAWELYHDYLRLSGLDRGARSWLARAVLHYVRLWDAAAAPRVDCWLADSNHAARRVKRVYGQEAGVIYPPVDVERFKPCGQKGDAYLLAGRLVAYKRADLAVMACTRLGVPLRIVGDGPELGRLRRMAGPSVTFLGKLSDDEIAGEMARARALIFPGEEDFGIAPVEAQAAGTPVIAYGVGGATETIIPPDKDDYSEATGLFFMEPTVDSLCLAIQRFEVDSHRFRPASLINNAARFAKQRFVEEMKQFIETKLEAFRGGS